MWDRSLRTGSDEGCLIQGEWVIRRCMLVNNFHQNMFFNEGGAVLGALCIDQLICVQIFSSGSFSGGFLFSVYFSVCRLVNTII